MPRKRFITPASIPEETVCRGLVLPASQDWLGVFSEALSQTIYAYNYEQVEETALTPEEAAAEAYNRYVAWLTAVCAGEGCGLQPNGSKVYRVNPTTKHYEYLQDEEWVQDETIPPTPARTEPTEEDRVCAAASNAVEVLRLTWVEAFEQYDANVAALDAQVDTALAISSLVGAVFYPPIIAMAGLTQLGWEIVYYTYEALTFADWDDEFTHLMVCLFVANATDDGDVVTFDYAGIVRGLWRGAFTGQAYLVMAGQIEWLLSWIAPDAMNAAGALELVEGDCTGCNEWCWVSDDWTEWERLRGGMLDGNGQVAITTGNPDYDGGRWGGNKNNYAEYQLVVDTSRCVITGYEWELAADANNLAAVHAGKIEPTDPQNGLFEVWPANYAFPTFRGYGQGSIESTTEETTLYMAFPDSPGGSARGTRWRVYGTGRNPFGQGSNC